MFQAYGGLRGAVAFCLVALLDINDIPHKNLFQTTVFVIVIFTVFIQVRLLSVVVSAVCFLKKLAEIHAIDPNNRTRLWLKVGVQNDNCPGVAEDLCGGMFDAVFVCECGNEALVWKTNDIHGSWPLMNNNPTL